MNNQESRQEKEFRKIYEQRSDMELFKESRHFAPHDVRSYMAQQILNERREKAEKDKENREEARHHEIQKRLEELKKPHWTVSPNFWATCIAAISAVVGCVLTWNSSNQVKAAPSAAVQQVYTSSLQQTQKKLLHQQTEHKNMPPNNESSLRH